MRFPPQNRSLHDSTCIHDSKVWLSRQERCLNRLPTPYRRVGNKTRSRGRRNHHDKPQQIPSPRKIPPVSRPLAFTFFLSFKVQHILCASLVQVKRVTVKAGIGTGRSVTRVWALSAVTQHTGGSMVWDVKNESRWDGYSCPFSMRACVCARSQWTNAVVKANVITSAADKQLTM